MRRRTGRDTDDGGQVMLLTLGYTLIAFSLIVVAVDATAVHLARTQLWDAADAAALDAADSIDGSGEFGQPLTRTQDPPARPNRADPAALPARQGQGSAAVLVVTDRAVRERATDYLATYQLPSRVSDVRLGPGSGRADGGGAEVVLTATVRLPIGGAVVAAWSDGITITVRSTAQARVTLRAP